MPSCLYMSKDGQKLFGREALDQKYLDPAGYFENLKQYVLKSSGFQIRHNGSAQWVEPHELVGLYLGELVRRAESAAGRKADHAVPSIPATYTAREEAVMRKAAAIAGLSDVEFLHEPVAAAIHYAETGQLSLKEGELSLVYDFGGGTFDATLI